MLQQVDLFAAIWATMLAVMNIPRVKQMRRDGASSTKSKIFHGISLAAKIVFAALAWYYYSSWKAGVISGAMEYLVFDVALNLFTGFPWNYEGGTAWLDVIVGKIGDSAMAIKSGACIIVILLLNFL